jgi:hypothetical protein
VGRSASLAIISAIALIVLTGCAPQQRSAAPPKSTADSARVKALQSQVDALQQLVGELEAKPEPEPKGDVSDGLYLGRITRIDSRGATTTVVVDFASDAFMPWETPEHAKKSSWPRYYGWNRYRHAQSFLLPGDAIVFETDPDLKIGLGLVAVSVGDYVRQWRAPLTPDDAAVDYVQVADGKIAMVWPWRP